MESGSILALITTILSIVSVFFGAKYRKWLERGRLFAKLFDDIVAAAEDNEILEEEFQKIVADAKKVAAKMEE
ncbi:MAG: hypothetical protein NUK63_01780 [Candidatus Bathyarchaeum tardum]|nr:MAG: hypothetical protein NUK63_01780 [Candidatus Bathyarchaeum tardum]